MDTKNYLIVGGSSGIGLEIARALQEESSTVYVASRSNAALADLDGVH